MSRLPTTMLVNPNSEARPVDARWLRVLDLAAQGGQARHRDDDAWVQAGLRYARSLARCHDGASRRRLAETFPDLDAARQLHDGDRLTRGVVEARLLARQTPSEVAAAEGLTPGTVEAYAALFFDVADALEARSYVIDQAIGPRLFDGTLTEADADILLKHIGFLKGPFVLEGFIHYFRVGIRIPEHPAGASAQELLDLADMLEVKAVVQARVLSFPKCCHALLLRKLAGELRAFTRAPAGVMRPMSGRAEPPVPAGVPAPVCLGESWWAELRAAVGA